MIVMALSIMMKSIVTERRIDVSMIKFTHLVFIIGSSNCFILDDCAFELF